LISQTAVCTAVLTLNRMTLMIFSSLFSLLLLLWDALFTQRFSALMCFSAVLMKIIAALRTFSVLHAVIKLKKFVFSVSNYLSLCSGVVSSLF
jgi:hypothetical protein